MERFVAAWERVDIPGLVELLREDAVMAMPPEPGWFAGAAAIGEFFATVPGEGDLTRVKLVRGLRRRREAVRPFRAAAILAPR